MEPRNMRVSPLLAFVALFIASGGATAAESRQVCDVAVDVTDTDPAGTHVRGTPGGAVIATLKNPGDGWIEVHLSAQLGDWYEIDSASLEDPDNPRVLFHGKGYLHKSMLGLSGMQNDATLYSDPDGKRPLVSHLAGDQPVDLLGCRGKFLRITVSKHTGWTKEACTNMNTTCA